MEAINSLFSLRWRQQRPKLKPLPESISRTFVATPGGDLELLISAPKDGKASDPGIFFIHGGYGSAGVWLEWMDYIHKSGYGGPLYAYSARNHGASYSVPYLKMVYGTSFDEIIKDFKACYQHARKEEASAKDGGGDIVLVGHSSGGGVAQYALSTGTPCGALCLVDAIPHFGALGVYANWAWHDPLFLLRMLCHLQHPTSPLSSPQLVHGAFFCPSYPRSSVQEFMKWMPAYESVMWPMGMMGSFWQWLKGSPSWLDVKMIVSHISGSREDKLEDKVCVMVGSEDVLMDVGMARRQAAEYRETLAPEFQISKTRSGYTQTLHEENSIEGVTVESAGGARLVVVNGAGHHLQNDMQRKAGVEALLQFIRHY